jgi:hypothetical protein
MNLMLLGAISISSIIAGAFFLRYWTRTKDRLFLFFAVSFFIEGLNRFALGTVDHPSEANPFFYIVRFVSFSLILVAIIQKNVGAGRSGKTASKAAARSQDPA